MVDHEGSPLWTICENISMNSREVDKKVFQNHSEVILLVLSLGNLGTTGCGEKGASKVFLQVLCRH